MLAPAVLAIIGATILVTSFISGIFGMAGGLILLGVLLLFMDVAPAMVLFGTIQTASNGWRAALWVRHVDWGIVWRYLVGSTAMFLLLRTVAILPSKAMLYIGLGLIPFAADLLPKRLTPDITRPGAPYICGAFIIVLQLLAGAAGHILDIFFQKSQLDRKIDRRHQGGDAGRRATSTGSPISARSNSHSTRRSRGGPMALRLRCRSPARRWRRPCSCA